MATPMNLGPNMCGLCFEAMDVGTFDVDAAGLVLVNVCVACRIWENRQLIKLRSAWEGNGHPSNCPCLGCHTL